MNHAKLEKSGRLQAIMQVLSDGQWHSTKEIYDRQPEKNMAVSTTISEIRNGAGIPILSRRVKGADIWEYRLGRAA